MSMDALLVDDSSTMRLRLRRLLEAEPDVIVTDHGNPAAALIEARTRAFDLILIDHHMPEMAGVTFVEILRAIPHYARVPIVMITSDVCDAVRIAALEAGATDFLDKRSTGVELGARLRNMVRLATAVRRLDDQAGWLASEVEMAVRHLREREEEIIFRLSLAVEYRDNDTGDHTWRVARYSQIMAEALDLDPALCRRIYLAAPLHDVGKVAIPDTVLLKPGKLDAAEFDLVKTHTHLGARVLSGSTCELIRLAADIAESHHERWDGSGYPHGRAGEQIPLAARIVAVADVFDALTSERPYKAAMPFDLAVEAIQAESGRHFDPACVAAFCSRLDEIRAARASAGDAARRMFAEAKEPWARVPALLREAAGGTGGAPGWTPAAAVPVRAAPTSAKRGAGRSKARRPRSEAGLIAVS